ncbi:MFS general substrate transporter [Rhizoclosmatium globosum]|uniref:MFS general substrate transporter n=1 Tax=Rhizoclosmatium globosum TaxID=329046 RepID=A0A1Y2CVJ2_9FUNG|nr:MFS general substrate transporter [Rhizoclosmatium globosum]|eukprot:ORY51043.1 MFS general substrate transporter [Rhizoclosmatium globosum]
MGIALCVYPLLPNYGALIAIRLLFALGGGASSSMLVAVLADYAHDKIRGRLAGLVGLCSGLGALLALFVFMPMPFKFGDAAKGLRVTFLIVGLLSVIFAVLLFFFLKPIKAPEEDDADKTEPEETESRKTFIQTAKEGILAAKDPKVLLGYVGSFLARGDTVIITLFVPLWVYKRYIELGNCNPVGGVEDPNIRDVCAEAFKRGSAISGVAQTFALVGAPLFGYLADRFSATSVVLMNAAIGCISYFVMFAADPMKSYVYAIVIFVGLSEIGLIIGNLSLVTNNDSVDKSIRGSVAGVSSACGAIGILISSKLGGALFDSWREGAPFFVLAIGHFIAAMFGVWVVVGEWKKRRVGAAASSDV